MEMSNLPAELYEILVNFSFDTVTLYILSDREEANRLDQENGLHNPCVVFCWPWEALSLKNNFQLHQTLKNEKYLVLENTQMEPECGLFSKKYVVSLVFCCFLYMFSFAGTLLSL